MQMQTPLILYALLQNQDHITYHFGQLSISSICLLHSQLFKIIILFSVYFPLYSNIRILYSPLPGPAAFFCIFLAKATRRLHKFKKLSSYFLEIQELSPNQYCANNISGVLEV